MPVWPRYISVGARWPLVLLALIAFAGCTGPAAELPPLPTVDLGTLDTQVAEQVRAAQAQAEASPDSGNANGHYAMVLHAYGLKDVAAAVYERARAHDPDAFQWHYLHGVVLQALARPREAEAAFRKANEVRAGYVPLWLRTAKLAADRGDIDTSRKTYVALTATEPALGIAHYELGQLLLQADETDAAVASLRRAVDLEPDFGAAQYALSNALRRLGDNEGAAHHAALFEQAGKREANADDPLLSAVHALRKSSLGRLAKALEYLKKGRRVEAAREFEAILDIDPDNYSAHINLVGLYGDLRDLDMAEAHYEKARAIAPDKPKLYNNMGIARLRNGQPEAAIAAFREAVRVDPGYAGAWRNLGKVLQDAGRNDEALDSYRKSIEIDRTDRQTQFFYGRLLARSGQPAEAVAPLEAALAPYDARTPHYQHELARALAALGDTDTARVTLLEAGKLARETRQPTLVARIHKDLALLEQTGALPPPP